MSTISLEDLEKVMLEILKESENVPPEFRLTSHELRLMRGAYTYLMLKVTEQCQQSKL